ncbi:MAG: hypothetical protein FD126_397 [Elusimicrobia bacterium]|nr:MAG: hypothetical protein FD126_397 [Elusimicrobiota bacterium]
MRAALVCALVALALPSWAMRALTPAEEGVVTYHVAIASQAIANDEYQMALAKKMELEKAMRLTNGDHEASRAPSEEELARLNGWFRDRRDEYRQAVGVVERARRVERENYNEAIRLTAGWMGWEPALWSGGVRNGHPALLGRPIAWAPRFSNMLEEGETGSEAFDGRPALTRPDGTVVLRAPAFKNMAELANAIRHEAMHWDFTLSETAYDLRNMPTIEKVLNRHQLTQEAVFRFGTVEWTKMMMSVEGWHLLENKWTEMMSQGFDPYSRPDVFSGIDLTSEERRRIEGAVTADLRDFKYVLAAGGSDGDLEWLKTNAQSTFLKELSPDQLRGIVNGWYDAKKTDLEAPARAQEFRRVWIEREAQACGFQLTPDWEFYSVSGVLRVYHGGEVERARAALLLIDACQREGRPEAGPCNDAIGIVTARWAEPRFKDSMMVWKTNGPFIDGESTLGQCLLELRESWAPRGDFSDLKAVIERNYVRRRAGRQAPQPPKPPREPREPRDNPAPPSRGGDCYWSNDGREVCPP